MKSLNRAFAALGGGTMALIPASCALAAPFVVMHANEQLVTFADQGSLRREPGSVTVWTYTVPSVDLSDGSGLMASKTEVDCSRGRFRDVYVATYNWSGDAVTKQDAVEGWQVAVPDTSGARLIGLACRGYADQVLSGEGTFLDVARVARAALEAEH